MLLLAGAIIALPINHSQAMQNNESEEKLHKYYDEETQNNTLTDEQLDDSIQQNNTHQKQTTTTIDIKNPELATIMQSFINLCNIKGIVNEKNHQTILHCLKSALHNAPNGPIHVAVKQLDTQNIFVGSQNIFARIPIEISITNNKDHAIEICENTIKRQSSPITFIKSVAATYILYKLMGSTIPYDFVSNNINNKIIKSNIEVALGYGFILGWAASLAHSLSQIPLLIKSCYESYYPSTSKIVLRPHESKSIIAYFNPHDIEKIPNEIIRSPAFETFTKEFFHS